MSKQVTVTIDGQTVTAEAGATILEVARAAGLAGDIPLVCYSDYTTANGLCRMCVVEAEGNQRLLAACVEPVRDGLKVHTRTPSVEKARRTILEMLEASVNLAEAPGLQALLAAYQSQPERFTHAALRQPPVIDDNPLYVRDYAQCILCWRCVQVCAEDAQYTFALNFEGRGFHTQIGTFYDHPMPDTTCVFCGQCVGACPTGALKSKREFLLEEGVAPKDVFELTRVQGRKQKEQRVVNRQRVTVGEQRTQENNE